MVGGGRRRGKEREEGVGGGRGREEERDFLDNFKYLENILLIFLHIKSKPIYFKFLGVRSEAEDQLMLDAFEVGVETFILI